MYVCVCVCGHSRFGYNIDCPVVPVYDYDRGIYERASERREEIAMCTPPPYPPPLGQRSRTVLIGASLDVLRNAQAIGPE